MKLYTSYTEGPLRGESRDERKEGKVPREAAGVRRQEDGNWSRGSGPSSALYHLCDLGKNWG